jgi:predicted transposase YdaD
MDWRCGSSSREPALQAFKLQSHPKKQIQILKERGTERRRGEKEEGREKGRYKIPKRARCQWLMPVILATQEAGIRRIAVQSQPKQII